MRTRTGASAAAGADNISGGDGSDYVDYSAVSAPLEVTVADGAANDGATGEGDNVQPDNEIVFGGSGDDRLYGPDGSGELWGRDGADQLFGGNSDDRLEGEGGNDRLEGGYRGDVLNGGDGVDTVDYSWHSVTDTGTGEVFGVSSTPNGIADDGNFSVDEGLAGTDNVGADVENVFGSDGPDYIEGTADANRLRGAGNNDHLLGMGGNDLLEGETGGDELEGGAEADVLRGGDQADRLTGGSEDDVLDGGTDADTLIGQAASTRSPTPTARRGRGHPRRAAQRRRRPELRRGLERGRGARSRPHGGERDRRRRRRHPPRPARGRRRQRPPRRPRQRHPQRTRGNRHGRQPALRPRGGRLCEGSGRSSDWLRDRAALIWNLPAWEATRRDMRAITASLAGIAVALATVLAAGSAVASPYIQAHRGGPIVNGKPRFGENTMPAFRDSAERGFVLEFDVKLTSDDVPVVFHDATLDRATDCEGRIDQRTYAELRSCRVDILGSEGNFKQLGRRDDRRVRDTDAGARARPAAPHPSAGEHRDQEPADRP